MPRTRILVIAFSEECDLPASVKAILSEGAPNGYHLTEQILASCGTASCQQNCGLEIRRFGAQVLLLCADLADDERLIAVLQEARAHVTSLPVLTLFKAGSPKSIASLLRAGAQDFIMAPLRAGDLLSRVAWWAPPDEKKIVDGSLREKLGLKHFIGESPALLSAIQRIPALAACDANVLITGETGTGKELCARAIHYLSPRSHKPFVPINCGAIPVELVENELFGHEAGAFTSANYSSPGLLRAADGGTVLLDEIDSLPGSAQVKLLRFLQERQIQPLGSAKVYTANIRVIAASNAALDEAVKTQRFRVDLYYRLNVVPIDMPPLRQRLEDVPLLAHHFLQKYSTEFKKGPMELSGAAIRKLTCYDWPGNIRELENIIARALVLAPGPIIADDDIALPNASAASDSRSFRSMKARVVADFERGYIQQLLLANNWNITRAADAAKKHRRAFWHLMRKHEIKPPQRPLQDSSL
jgi:DNA-binding NtrC family response regulator